jgi:glycosyltransferase involved in cell wall biosynthesis
MQNNPKISILLPFKNEETYIEQCINSIINQDYQDWELIAIDDHSNDKSTEIVKSFSLLHANIHYILNSGHGVISALQNGLLNCNGDCITRMDGDDYKGKNNLSSLMEILVPGSIAIGKVKYFREGGLGDGYAYYESWINEVNGSGRTWSEIYRECVIPSPCWLVYKEDLMDAGAFDSDYYPEDYDLSFRFYKAGLKAVCTQGIIHYWRDHNTRTTRVSPHYSDNHFTFLKVHYFAEIDFDPNFNLALWGAGKKAKKVAKLLKDRGLNFRWLTNNSKKIGQNIYDVVVEDSNDFTPPENCQIIVAMANFEEQVNTSQLTNASTQIYRFF